MELLQGDAFYDLFRAFADEAFHLEVQDTYHTPDETEPLRRFLSGQHDDLSWHQPWLELVRNSAAAGRRFRRVRIVSIPHVDYTRWGLAVAQHNITAGEDIRWLPRHIIPADAVTSDDFWLFDGARVVFTVFEPNGRFAGGAVTSDPQITEYCRRVRNLVWSAAVPHAEYSMGDDGS